ncbi:MULTISPECIES: DNA-deoxyinosine glycosylase [Oceanobacillus]|uniref:DNA-deoxyinosine glycosylase n=1 Tax=Oceanobacillus TaxID=182709 RepID=UPI000A714945
MIELDKKIVSFPPVLPDEPRVLILGSMPSVKSLEEQQYYGNPRNHFWPILFALFQENKIDNYDDRIDFVKKHGIALWDAIAACYREGSLDSSIKDAEANDIAGLLERYPTIRFIGCNGTKAFDTFKKHFDFTQFPDVHVKKLPSTSPIPGRFTKTFDEKVESWSIILKFIPPQTSGGQRK